MKIVMQIHVMNFVHTSRGNFYYKVKPIKFGKDDLYPVTGSDQ